MINLRSLEDPFYSNHNIEDGTIDQVRERLGILLYSINRKH